MLTDLATINLVPTGSSSDKIEVSTRLQGDQALNGYLLPEEKYGTACLEAIRRVYGG